MSENLSEETVRRVAELARLHLSADQVQTYRRQLEQVLAHLETLSALDVGDVEPMAHPLPLSNRLQDDIEAPTLPVQTLLELAPAVEGPYLAVPKVLGEGGG